MYWRIWDLWGLANMVASTVAELDDTLPYLQGVQGIVYGPPTDARWGTAWKTCTRVMWARLDSLIVIVNCCHPWCLHDLHVPCCWLDTLARFKLTWVAMTLSNMSDSCLLLSFRSNSTFIMLYMYHEMDVDYLVVDMVLNINVNWSQLHV
jgi:hypothetical protein